MTFALRSSTIHFADSEINDYFSASFQLINQTHSPHFGIALILWESSLFHGDTTTHSNLTFCKRLCCFLKLYLLK